MLRQACLTIAPFANDSSPVPCSQGSTSYRRRQGHLSQRKNVETCRYTMPQLSLVRPRPRFQARRHTAPIYNHTAMNTITILSLHRGVKNKKATLNKVTFCDLSGCKAKVDLQKFCLLIHQSNFRLGANSTN